MLEYHSNMLQRGDNGDSVGHAQEILRRLGAKITDAPGRFGLSTEAAIYCSAARG
jgi:peptidoglycan hydrolase-like protein with peptidoglycan-binding domain